MTTLSKLFLALLCCVFLITCKKKEEGSDYGPCGRSGGVTTPNVYVFWIDHDFGCGYITVEIKNSDGVVVGPNNHGQVRMYDATAPACSSNTYINHPDFDLYMGKTYTYRATCTSKVWTGTINVPCEQNKCYQIQLQ